MSTYSRVVDFKMYLDVVLAVLLTAVLANADLLHVDMYKFSLNSDWLRAKFNNA